MGGHLLWESLTEEMIVSETHRLAVRIANELNRNPVASIDEAILTDRNERRDVSARPLEERIAAGDK